MRASECVTQWAKIGTIENISFIGKEAVCFGVGCFIKFINLRTLEHHVYDVNLHNVHGEGVKSLRGHRSLNIFAYSEDCQHPDLYVMAYPEFEVIFKVDGAEADPEGYKCLTFSDTSLLFTLGELPNYTVTVWNWRRGRKFAQSKNELLYENQILRCSFGRPMYLAQVGIGSHHLLIWDVFYICSSVIFAKHEVTLGRENPALYSDVCWTSEGGLFVADIRGSVYTVDKEFILQMIIDSPVEQQSSAYITWYRNGLAVCGPDDQIRLYSKSGSDGEWVCKKEVRPEKKIVFIVTIKNEKIIGLTERHEVVYFNFDNQITYLSKEDEACFYDFCLIYPTGEFLVALCYGEVLNVIEVVSGKRVSTMKLKAKALTMAENPELPYIAVGTEVGELLLVSFHNETKPSIMVSFHLTTSPINKLKFFENGRIIVAGFLDSGEFYIIEGYPGTQMHVITSINTNCQIADYILVGSENYYRFFVLPVTSTRSIAGNQIIRYCIVGSQTVNIKTYEFEDPDTLYSHIIQTTGHHRDRIFYAIPFQSRVMHVLESKRADNIMKKTNEIRTAHLLRRFKVHISTYHAVTWGFDGIVAVTDNNFTQDVGITVAHHRYSAGVRKAYVDPLSQFTVALGYDGVLAVMRMPYNEIDQDRKDYLYTLKNSDKLALLFIRPTLGFTPELRFANMTWIDIQKVLQFEKEQAQTKDERIKIQREFQEIRKILQNLVTKNLEGPDNEKIDLVEFYLDTSTYNKMQIDNKEECKRREIYLRALIAAQDKVSKFMIQTYWETMGVIWKLLKGLFTVQEATNYCLLPERPEPIQRLTWIEEVRRMERFLSCYDTFEPWVPMEEEKLREVLAQRPSLPKDDYNTINSMRIFRDIEEADASKTIETKIAIAGSLAQMHIPVSPARYEQRQIVTYYQGDLQQAIIEYEVIKLKQQANKAFEELMRQKEREMYNIKEKHNRLRYIISEYNYFSERKIYIPIIDPEWIQEENPVMITRVTDDELTIGPYISPSEQAILDAKAAEEERIRLLLLADDFRERALMAMMNGVLEVRWEDELKKEVPKPKCMLEKEPENFNEEDLRACRDYEEKVVSLNAEREKYKSLLEAEFNRLSTSVRDNVRKFNQKVWECTKSKMYIDSAMNQENLQVNRARVIQRKRIAIDEKEQSLLKTVMRYERLLERQYKIISGIIEKSEVCKGHLENMQTKDKVLDKAFKRDIQDMSPLVQEVAGKLYKKRPKVNLRTVIAASLLNELARCVITNEKTALLVAECIEYLKSLDELDQNIGLPPSIDDATFGLICRYRRQRIEYEIRMRAAQMQIQDGDYTLLTFQNRALFTKQNIAEVNKEIEKTREERLRLLLNLETQIVLRRGLVEIALTGSLEDFANAILVPKKEIISVNNYIVATGHDKIKVIKKNMAFRRNIMSTEWDHKYLRMQINDLIEQKADIECVPFTKEMQIYLKNKALGRKTEADSFEWELELLTASYGQRIKDKKDKYMKIKKQLNSYNLSNDNLDKAIKESNIDICSFKLQKDYELETREPEVIRKRMEAMIARSDLVEQIQKNYNEILILQTEMELLRLRTYPNFKYRIIDK